MWIQSDLFLMCLLVAYKIRNIGAVENGESLLRIKNLNEIINQASGLIDKYNILNSLNTKGFKWGLEKRVIDNKIKITLKDATRNKENGNYNTAKETSEIEIRPLESEPSPEMRQENVHNEHLLKNWKKFYNYPSRSANFKSIDTYRGLHDFKSSVEIVAILQKILQNKHAISRNNKKVKIDEWVEKLLKKYNLNFVVLKNIPYNLRPKIINDIDNFVIKHVKGEKEDALILANFKKTETNEDKNVDFDESDISGKANGGLRGGCTNCGKWLIRKCFKALKASTKTACRIYHCKSGFKSSFKSTAKTACLLEFTDDYEINNKTKLTCKKKRSVHIMRGGNFNFCGSSKTLRELSDNNLRELAPMYNVTLNILRDKFEKACNKELHKKCVKACSCTIRTTCDEHKCMKKKINKLTKDCKAECRSTFSTESSDSDGSTESTDDSTDEDSDYDD